MLGFHLRLCPINSIKGLVEEKTNRPASIHPSWHVLVEGRIVPQESKEVEEDEAEARQRNLQFHQQSKGVRMS